MRDAFYFSCVTFLSYVTHPSYAKRPSHVTPPSATDVQDTGPLLRVSRCCNPASALEMTQTPLRPFGAIRIFHAERHTAPYTQKEMLRCGVEVGVLTREQNRWT